MDDPWFQFGVVFVSLEKRGGTLNARGPLLEMQKDAKSNHPLRIIGFPFGPFWVALAPLQGPWPWERFPKRGTSWA